MNNRIKLLAAVLIIATIVFAFVIGASSVLAGDINKDGKVQAGDARLALRHVAKLDTLKGEQFNIADMDGDGKVNASDARMILRIAAKLDPERQMPTSATTTKPTTTKPSTTSPTTTQQSINLVNDDGKGKNDGEVTLF
ncbi:MAG: hypothetical protein GX264_05510 [Clostridiales bacterium]|jgi:hypothetical protein|nr:hypothetical protein [Clostridiales bacterium]